MKPKLPLSLVIVFLMIFAFLMASCGREPTAPAACTAGSAYRIDTLPAPNGYIAVVYWCH